MALPEQNEIEEIARMAIHELEHALRNFSKRAIAASNTSQEEISRLRLRLLIEVIRQLPAKVAEASKQAGLG